MHVYTYVHAVLLVTLLWSVLFLLILLSSSPLFLFYGVSVLFVVPVHSFVVILTVCAPSRRQVPPMRTARNP